MEKKKIETLTKILSRKNLRANFETDFNGKFKIKSIGKIDGKTKIDINFKVKSKDKRLEHFDAFIKGKDFGKIEFDSNNFFDFKFAVSGINLLPDSEDGFKFSITSLPTETGILDVYFEDGFELNGIIYKVFKSSYKFEAICTYKSSQLKTTFSFEDNSKRALYFNYEQINDFENVKEAIECYEFLQRLANSMPLTLYSKNRDQTIVCTPPANQIPLSEINNYLEYYKSLQKIEILFKEKFRNITPPRQEYYDRMLYLIKYSKPVIELVNKEICFEIVGDKVETIKNLKEIYESGNGFEVELQNEEVYEINGKNIILGCRTMEFKTPYIMNLNELIYGKEEIVKIQTHTYVKITYRK